MAWSRDKALPENINGNSEFTTNDNLTITELNAIVNNSFYASDIAEEVKSQVSNLGSEDKLEFKGSNPNILINGDFRINQRGKSEYRKQGYSYTVDRWKVYVGDENSDYIITPSSNGGITLNNINGTGGLTLLQFLEEDYEIFAGKTFVVSAKINGVIYSAVANFPETEPTSALLANVSFYDGLGALSVIFDTYRKKISIEVSLYGNTEIFIDYVKMELGLIATPNSPRLYAEELALCQRYYQKVSMYGVGGGKSTEGTGVFAVSIPTTLRTNPTITTLENIIIRGNAKYENITSIELASLQNNLLVFNVKSPNLEGNYTYLLSGGLISVDAEIY